MVEPGRAAGFPQRTVLEPGFFLVAHPVRRYEFLDRHVPVEHLVAGQPDSAHAAGADRLAETIPTGDAHASDRHPRPHRRLGFRIVRRGPVRNSDHPGTAYTTRLSRYD